MLYPFVRITKKLAKSIVFSQAADNRSMKMLFLAAQFIHRRLTIPILSKWKKKKNTIFTQIFDCTTNMNKKKKISVEVMSFFPLDHQLL